VSSNDDAISVEMLAEAGDYKRAAEAALNIAAQAERALSSLVTQMSAAGCSWQEISDVVPAAPKYLSKFWPGTSAAALHASFGSAAQYQISGELASRAKDATPTIRALREALDEARAGSPDGLSHEAKIAAERLQVAQWRHVYDDCTPTEKRTLRTGLNRSSLLMRYYLGAGDNDRAELRDDGTIVVLRKQAVDEEHTTVNERWAVATVEHAWRRFGTPDRSAYEDLAATFTDWPAGGNDAR
jgi:hypothetical protein